MIWLVLLSQKMVGINKKLMMAKWERGFILFIRVGMLGRRGFILNIIPRGSLTACSMVPLPRVDSMCCLRVRPCTPGNENEPYGVGSAERGQ